jgi:FixJ family two-component response regulator
MSQKKMAIYIVDDDKDFRESLVTLVSMLGYNAVSFSSAEEFLGCSSIKRPACLLLDIYLPNIDGLQLQAKMRAFGILIPIIFITGHGDVPMGIKAMKEGATDFLLKPFDKQELQSSIVLAIKKDANCVREEAAKRRILSNIARLTPREQEVMRQVITGKLNKQTASTLGIAEKTVRIHRSNFMRKLKVSSVAALVRMLAKAGITHSSVELSRS